MPTQDTFKVIQWASGSMGNSCMRAVIDRPDLELVGLYVYGDRKVGKDAGEIARRDATGVIATNNRDDILALEADVVIHASRLGRDHEAHDDDIAALLASGKNVISINGNSHPPHWPEARRNKLQAACEAGGSTFLGTGLNPGFAAEKLLVTASSVCIDLNRVSLSEWVETNVIPSPEYVFDRLAFGSEIGAVDMNGEDWEPALTLNGLFEDVVAGVAAQLNWPLEKITRAHRMLPAREDIEIAAGTIKKGTASHIEWRWRGVVNGEERVMLDIAWAMNDDYRPSGQDALWKLKLEGLPDVAIDVHMTKPADRQGRTSAEQYGVAGSVINSIRGLVAHPPGLASPTFAANYYQPETLQ